MRLDELKQIDIASKNPNLAGVMAVFYPTNKNSTSLALILRKTYKGVHSNQVGFPGGRVEPEDENLEETAKRETEEEIGIPRNDIRIIGSLTKVYIPPSNFWVHPFMGYLESTPVLVAQESEVESILEIDLDHFLEDSSIVNQQLNTSYAKNIEVPAFLLNDQIVWGATAMMLSELKQILLKIL